MAAYVEHSFSKGFLLDEERLRKLNSLIGERLGKAEPPLKHTFRVYRADSYSYETENVDNVAKEDNSNWQRITRLEVKAEQKDVFEFALTFSDEGTLLKMIGDDRDRVYLLFSDLKEYIQGEINIGFQFTRSTRQFLSVLVTMAATLILPFSMLWNLNIPKTDPVHVKQVIADTNTVVKLDYLVERTLVMNDGLFSKTFMITFAIILPVVFLVCFTPIGEKLFCFFFPSNLFLFGCQKQRFEKRRRLLSNLLWGGLIAFVISVAAGFLVWRMTLTK